MKNAVRMSSEETRINPVWIADEERAIIETLEATEKAEAEAWALTAILHGMSERGARSQQWSHWHFQAVTALATLSSSGSRIQVPAATPATSEPEGCSRRGGFLERVKLPMFSGAIEDYGEYKSQFKELCRGESYTDVIVLAQMRQKLPKEALSLIYGIGTSGEAWARLDETYGNTDLQVLAALKRLRNFKVGKSSAHDQVVEVANAVQRCVTILKALGREEDLLMDQETLAEVIALLPIDSQQRWYHQGRHRVGSHRDKGQNLLVWLEEERADAVAIRLDSLARRPKQAPPTAAPKQPATTGGTDQSLFNAAHVVHNPSTDGVAALTQGEGARSENAAPAVGGRIAVTSEAQAKEVTAKRKANLETKKMDKCPICKLQHVYEKTWAQVVPPSQDEATIHAPNVLSSIPGAVQ